jgi:hypothetical protein
VRLKLERANDAKTRKVPTSQSSNRSKKTTPIVAKNQPRATASPTKSENVKRPITFVKSKLTLDQEINKVKANSQATKTLIPTKVEESPDVKLNNTTRNEIVHWRPSPTLANRVQIANSLLMSDRDLTNFRKVINNLVLTYPLSDLCEIVQSQYDKTSRLFDANRSSRSNYSQMNWNYRMALEYLQDLTAVVM